MACDLTLRLGSSSPSPPCYAPLVHKSKRLRLDENAELNSVRLDTFGICSPAMSSSSKESLAATIQLSSPADSFYLSLDSPLSQHSHWLPQHLSLRKASIENSVSVLNGEHDIATRSSSKDQSLCAADATLSSAAPPPSGQCFRALREGASTAHKRKDDQGLRGCIENMVRTQGANCTKSNNVYQVTCGKRRASGDVRMPAGTHLPDLKTVRALPLAKPVMTHPSLLPLATSTSEQSGASPALWMPRLTAQSEPCVSWSCRSPRQAPAVEVLRQRTLPCTQGSGGRKGLNESRARPVKKIVMAPRSAWARHLVQNHENGVLAK